MTGDRPVTRISLSVQAPECPLWICDVVDAGFSFSSRRWAVYVEAPGLDETFEGYGNSMQEALEDAATKISETQTKVKS